MELLEGVFRREEARRVATDDADLLTLLLR